LQIDLVFNTNIVSPQTLIKSYKHTLLNFCLWPCVNTVQHIEYTQYYMLRCKTNTISWCT